MPANLNRQPVGLLEFFAIKNGGEYPQQLSTTLQPTLDLEELYEATRIDAFMSPFQAHVVGLTQWGPTGAVSGAPAVFHYRKAFAVLNCSPVGAAGSLAIGFVEPAGGNFCPLTPTVYANQAVASSAHSQTVFFEDFWLPQGYPLGIYGTNIAGAPLVSVGWIGAYYRA